MRHSFWCAGRNRSLLRFIQPKTAPLHYGTKDARLCIFFSAVANPSCLNDGLESTYRTGFVQTNGTTSYTMERLILLLNKLHKCERQLAIGFFLFLIVLIVLRAPNILLEPRFWAEEGSIYFAHALQSNIIEGIFFSPKNTAGYFLLAASIPSTISAHFVPVEYAPFITTYFSFAILLLLFSLVIWGESYFWKTLTQKVLACLIVLFFPYSNATGEIWLNTINLQVYCGLLALIIAFEHTTELSEIKAWFLRITLVFCILSGVYAIFLSPIYILKYWHERSKESLIHLSILVLGALIQIVALIYIQFSGLISVKKLVVFSWAKSSISVLTYQVIYPLFGQGLGQQVLNKLGLDSALRLEVGQNPQYALLAGWVSLSIIAIPLVLLVVKRIKYTQAVLILGFVLLAILTSVMSMGGIAGGRYAVLPSIIIGFILLSIMIGDEYSTLTKYLTGSILVCSIVIGSYEYQFKTQPQFVGSHLPRPNWRDQVIEWRDKPDEYLTIWPYPRWKVSLPLPNLVKQMKQQLADLKPIYLESDGGWHSKSFHISGIPVRFSFVVDVNIKSYSEDATLQVLLLGDPNKNMRWMSINLDEMTEAETFQINIDSRQLIKKGELSMSDVNEVVFRLKGANGNTALELSGFHYQSPHSALF